MSVTEQNKAVVRRLIEAGYNRGNLDVLDELLSPNIVEDYGSTPGEDSLEGHEAIEEHKEWIEWLRSASSDLHFSIEEQIAEGDKVVTWRIVSGAHEFLRVVMMPLGLSLHV